MLKMIPWIWGRLPLSMAMRQRIIWLLSPKYTVGVVGLVRDDEGRVLLLKHTYRLRQPWGMPGGGLQAHETLEDCLRREVREEAGIEVDIGPLLSAAAHLDRKLVDMIFSCRPLPGQSIESFRPNAEIAEAGFFDPANLPEAMSRGQRRLIMTALAQAERPGSFRFQPEKDEWP